MSKYQKCYIPLIAATTLILSACNGGSSSNSGTTSPTSGLTTSFTGGNSFNATTDDPTANKILTLANTGESNISDITFTLPTNNYFTLTNDDTGVKPCTIGTDNTLTNALESNQSCTVKVTYSNSTTTSSASTNIVFDYLYGQSNKTLNTPITYQTTSSTSPTNSWVYVGDKITDTNMSTAITRGLAYDQATNSIYQISNDGTQICTISANADTDTQWKCTPTFSGFNRYGTWLTTNGNGNLFTIAQKSSITSDGQLYLQTYNTVSKTVSSTKMVLQTESGSCINCLSNFIDKPLVYSGGSVFYSDDANSMTKINATTAMTTRTQNVLNPTADGGSYAVDKNSNIYYNSSSKIRYVNINSAGGVTSSILGSNNYISNGITVAGNNLYGCGYLSGVYYTPLGSSSTTTWSSLPPTSQYLNITTGCNQITSSSSYLYVVASIYNSNNNLETRLLKYKY